MVEGVHVHRVEVRFGDCDPAGIVYYPKFFDFFHAAMETWFYDVLGYPYSDVIVKRKIGFPSVHTEADFLVPCSFGDSLSVELRVAKLGGSSIHFDYVVRSAGAPDSEPRVTGAGVCVVMDLDPQSPDHRRAIQIPADLRTRIEQFKSGA